MALKFEITGDNSNLLSSLEGARNGVHKAARDIEESGMSIEDLFKRIAAAAGIAFSIDQAKGFVNKVMNVRGQFQQLEIAFGTMLQSEEKATALMGQLIDTAAKTPFDLAGISEGAKQLLAYGTAAEDVNETITRLGDIAAGLSIPLGDLVYLYGTTMTQGRMFTMDLRQFQGRGIPIADELAKIFGVAKSKVSELVTAGKVGAEQVKQAIWNMTNEGSKFGGLMEKQSSSITGQISNIEDAFDSMLNDIGKDNGSLINGALSVVSDLVENYERVGRIIASVISAYGVYKASVIAVCAAERIKIRLLEESVVQQKLAAMQGVSLSNAQATAAAKTALLSRSVQALNKVLVVNPYVLLTTAIAGTAAALMSLKTQSEIMAEAENKYQEQLDETIKKENEHKNRIDELISVAGNEALSTDTRREALVRLEQQYPSIFAKYETEYEKLKNIRKIKEDIAALDGKSSVTNPDNELFSVNKRINALMKKGAAVNVIQNGTAGAFVTQTGGRTQEEEVELAMLRKRRDKLEKTIKKNSDDTYLANLTGISNKDLQAQINERKNLLAMMKMNEYKYGRTTKGGAKGVYSSDELQGQLQILESEQKRRNTPKVTAGERKSKLKKTWDEAKKALADFDKSSTKYTVEEVEKKRKELQDAVDTAEKEYKTFGGDTKDHSGKREEKRKKDEKEKTQRIREAEDLERSVTDATIAAMEDGAEKIRLQREQQNKEEILALERKKEDAIKAAKEANKSDKAGIDVSAISAQYDELIRLKKKEQLQALEKESLQSMREFLKEYGSFEQQRLAIAEEYEEAIAKATTEGERLSLQKERDAKLGSLTYSTISAGIDWRALFSGVGSISEKMMRPMMEQLMAYTKTGDYLNADSQTQQDVASLIQELRQYMGTDHSMTWQALGKATQDFTDAVGVYNQAVLDEKAAVTRLEQAKADLKAGKITQEAYDTIKADTDRLGRATQDARDSMQHFATTLNDTSEQVSNYMSGLTAALNKAKGWVNVDGFGDIKQTVAQVDAIKGALDAVLPSMSEGIGKTIGDGLSSTIGSGLSSVGSGLSSILSSGLGQTIGFVAQIPKLILNLVSSVKSFVTGILDSFTELVSLRWIDDLVKSICDAIGNLINAIFDLPENLFKVLEGVVVDGIGGLLDSVIGRVGNVLSLGALSSDGPSSWFTNSNAAKVNATIASLTDENKILEQAIRDLTDEMQTARGSAAIDITRRAADLQQQTNTNYLEIAKAQASYHNAHGSWNSYWSGFNKQQIDRLGGQIGRDWNGDIWDLSPEEMKMLRSNVDMWNQIVNTGKGGYGERVADKLNDYIDQAEKLGDITERLYENLTTTTEDNVFEDFLSSLYDLADDSEEVFDNIADEWQKMVNKMVINNLVGAKFQEKLKSWYEDLAKLNEQRTDENNPISEEAYKAGLDNLKGLYNEYVESAQKEIEALRDSGIIKATGDTATSQSGTKQGFATASQDSIDELNGRFTAMQISGDTIAQQAVQIYGQLIAMTDIQASSNNCLIEIRNMMITTNSYLDDVAKYSKKIYLDFGEKIDKVIKSTERI